MPDPSAVTEALEAVLDEVLPPYGSRFKKPILDAWGRTAAARSWVEGEEAELCEPHWSIWLNDDDGCEAAFSSQVKVWRNPCRKVSARICIEGEEGT